MIKITLFYFIISLFIGIMILYTIHPKPQVIIKYPNLNNVSKNIYKDDIGIIYNYKKEEIQCDNNI
jgi:hypothetical protein